MQPQDSGLDWSHGLVGILSGAFGAFSGVVASIWRIARLEPTIRMDFQTSLDAAEKRVGEKIVATEAHAEEKLEELVSQFHDTFSALRQKIGDIEIEALRTFVGKPDFDEWRREYREDMRDLKQAVTDLARKS